MKENFWKQFAQNIQGHFSEGKYGKSDQVSVSLGEFTIFLDYHTFYATAGNHTFEKTVTRIVAPYRTIDPFRFEISKQDIINTIETFLGAQDIKIYEQSFDKKFVVRSNDEYKIRALLQHSFIQDLIKSIKMERFLISDRKEIWGDSLAESERELALFLNGTSTDEENYRKIIDLFRYILGEIPSLYLPEISQLENYRR